MHYYERALAAGGWKGPAPVMRVAKLVLSAPPAFFLNRKNKEENYFIIITHQWLNHLGFTEFKEVCGILLLYPLHRPVQRLRFLMLVFPLVMCNCQVCIPGPLTDFTLIMLAVSMDKGFIAIAHEQLMNVRL